MTTHLLQDGTTVTLTESTTLEAWRDRQVAWYKDPKRTGKGARGGISRSFIQSVATHYTPAKREES